MLVIGAVELMRLRYSVGLDEVALTHILLAIDSPIEAAIVCKRKISGGLAFWTLRSSMITIIVMYGMIWRAPPTPYL